MTLKCFPPHAQGVIKWHALCQPARSQQDRLFRDKWTLRLMSACGEEMPCWQLPMAAILNPQTWGRKLCSVGASFCIARLQSCGFLRQVGVSTPREHRQTELPVPHQGSLFPGMVPAAWGPVPCPTEPSWKGFVPTTVTTHPTDRKPVLRTWHPSDRRLVLQGLGVWEAVHFSLYRFKL